MPGIRLESFWKNPENSPKGEDKLKGKTHGS